MAMQSGFSLTEVRALDPDEYDILVELLRKKPADQVGEPVDEDDELDAFELD